MTRDQLVEGQILLQPVENRSSDRAPTHKGWSRSGEGYALYIGWDNGTYIRVIQQGWERDVTQGVLKP